MIQSALAETKWVSHMQLILAKVPILRIRFYEPFTDITVDLNANNSVAIRNTHLLCYYSSCRSFLFLLYLSLSICMFLKLLGIGLASFSYLSKETKTKHYKTDKKTIIFKKTV